MKKLMISLLVMLSVTLSANAKTTTFKIKYGDNLINHTKDYNQTINIAEAFGLLVYKDRNKKIRISYREARRLSSKTDYIQVNVKVRPGWKFKLRNGNPVSLYHSGVGRWYSPKQFCKAFNKTHYKKFYAKKRVEQVVVRPWSWRKTILVGGIGALVMLFLAGGIAFILWKKGWLPNYRVSSK